jgi:hypothetical protein
VPIPQGFCLFIPVQLDIIIEPFCDAVKHKKSLAKNAKSPSAAGTS